MKVREPSSPPSFVLAIAAWGLFAGCSSPAQPESKVIAVPPPPPSEASEKVGPDAPDATSDPPPTATPSELGSLDRARVDNARMDTQAIAMAAELWRLSHPDTCPKYDDLIRDKALPPDRANEDPWGQPYSIECSDTGPTVISNGPDEKRGTADDVSGSRN